MNRPIKPTVEDDLTFEEFMCASGKWEKDIQEYCDYLEKEFELVKEKFRYYISDDIESYIHPCKGCDDYCYKSQECKSNGGCGNKEIDDMFKKQEKYRWHDLRKNPDDLPKTNVSNIVVYYDDIGEPIAWKYIEEFE